MVKGLIRKMMFGVVAGTIALGGAVGGVNYIYNNKLGEEAFYVDPENPKGLEICYLSEEDAGLPVTRADVYCDTVIIGIPQKEAPLQNPSKKDCGIYFKLEEDGKCHYYPPESFDAEYSDI